MEVHRYEIIVTHNRRVKCAPYPLTNLSAREHSEDDARCAFSRLVAEWPQYRLKLAVRTTANQLVDL